MLTKELVERAVPANLKSSVTQELVDRINTVVSDPIIAEQVRENFISYTGVLKDGKFKTEDYLNAVMYVSYKLMGATNLDAYAKTFPNRYTDLVARNVSSKDIAAYVSAYNKGKLVNLILEQTLVPTWVLNQHIYQKAINTQVELMEDPDVSAKVRSDAANSILTHLKKPEGKDFQINMDLRDTSGMNELKEALVRMAQQQQDLMRNGVTAKQIADSAIIEGESTLINES
jgi:hypothetical protein